MIKNGWFWIALLCLLVTNDAGAAAVKQAGSASTLSGRVMVLRGGQWRQMWQNDPYYVGDRVKTYADGKVTLSFVDASKLTLAPGSELEITTFLYDSGGARTGVFKLWLGKVKASVSKMSAGGGVKVASPTAVAGVRGTVLTVAIEPANPNNPPTESPENLPEAYNTTVAVIEGLVGVATLAPGGSTSGGEVLVKGGQTTTVSGDGSGVSAPRTMTPAEVTSEQAANNSGDSDSSSSSSSSGIAAQATNPEADVASAIEQSAPAPNLLEATTSSVAASNPSAGVPPVDIQPAEVGSQPVPAKIKMGVRRVD